eukprot:750713-Hanusia_phi.AAC.2
MKEDWEKLASQYSGTDTFKIGEVDCTSEAGKEICQQQGVHGFPTLKYRQSGGLWNLYMSGRSHEQLASFVEDEILPKCSLDHKSRCSVQDRAFIEKIEKMSLDDRRALEAELNKEIEEAKNAHTLVAQELESKYRESKEKAERLSKKIKVCPAAVSYHWLSEILFKFELSLLKNFGNNELKHNLTSSLAAVSLNHADRTTEVVVEQVSKFRGSQPGSSSQSGGSSVDFVSRQSSSREPAAFPPSLSLHPDCRVLMKKFTGRRGELGIGTNIPEQFLPSFDRKLEIANGMILQGKKGNPTLDLGRLFSPSTAVAYLSPIPPPFVLRLLAMNLPARPPQLL